jgi:hypothetical protein
MLWRGFMKVEKVNSSKVAKVKARLNRKLNKSKPGTRNYRRVIKGLHQIGEINKDDYKKAMRGLDVRRDFIDEGSSTGCSSLMEKLWHCMQIESAAREEAAKAFEKGEQFDFKRNMKRVLLARLAKREEISLHAS